MNNKLKGCFSHESDNWRTPSFLYDWIVKECEYFDPCPYLCHDFDGLNIAWPKNVFCNPPYSEISKWVDKAIDEHHRQYDSDIILLLPSRTDTKWFKKLYMHASEIKFITGRLHFNDSKAGAPFPSMMVHLYYGTDDVRCSVTDLHFEKERFNNDNR